jgi:hypothetical protein
LENQYVMSEQRDVHDSAANDAAAAGDSQETTFF